jgi:hypothetical protein
MNERKKLSVFLISWAVVFIAIGIVLGELHGRRAVEHLSAQNTAYLVIPECVREYDALAHGETNRAKRMCGQWLWPFLDFYEKQLADVDPPTWFPRWLPEARRIVGVVSNEDQCAIVVTNVQEAAFLRQMFGTNIPQLDTGK